MTEYASKAARYRVLRRLSWKNSPLPQTKVIEAGTILFGYGGFTYGCISATGMAVTLRPYDLPFFEVPADALQLIDPQEYSDES